MARGLVVLEPDEQVEELINCAMTFTAGTGGELVLLHVSEESSDVGDRDQMQAIIGRDSSYRPGLDGAEEFAADIGEQYIGNAVPFHSTAGLGEPAGRVTATVKEFDCDHIFILGRKRSPTGKAIFGDKTQSILLESDVPVTVIMRD
jgi:nucleotide-binding universal stress UspA family protein